MDHEHDDRVRPRRQDLALDHMQVLAQRGASEARSEGLRRPRGRKPGLHDLGKAASHRHLQRLDETVADEGDAAHTSASRSRG